MYKSTIFSLPIDILEEILVCLCPVEVERFILCSDKIKNFAKCARFLATITTNTTVSYFHNFINAKFELVLTGLPFHDSSIFFKINETEVNVAELVKTKKIVSIDISGSSFKELNQFEGISKVFAHSCQNVLDASALMKSEFVDLRYSNILSVSPLKNLHSLNLSRSSIKQTEIRFLSNIHTLDLSGTKIKDVSDLANVINLNLTDTHVINVNSLGSQNVLILRGTGVEDVSTLGNVHTLDISLTNVIDVSPLTNVHTLDITLVFIKHEINIKPKKLINSFSYKNRQLTHQSLDEFMAIPNPLFPFFNK